MNSEQDAVSARRMSLHGLWSSRLAFILAVSGSAVGLGNIWKFPYITGQNGGGAFVLVYIGCVFLIGVPVMMSEILLGRRGRRNPVATMALLGEEEGGTTQWRWIGALGVVIGVLILSYYSVIAGFSVTYVLKSVSGAFSAASVAEVGQVYANLTGSWPAVAAAHTVFMAITMFIVARGVERGLEQAVRIMVPGLLLLLLILLAYAVNSGGFAEGLAFMFRPDFASLDWQSVLVAMGHAFFTLSVGMGAVMAYGAYLPEETSIAGTSATVVIADTGIALLAGLVIFPLVFANGLNPGEGPGLVFVTLPLAFSQMAGGAFFATIFFLLLTLAALTSAIGLMEPAVAWFVEHRNRGRKQAALIVGGLIWLIGLGSVLSFNVLADLRFLRGTIYQNVDYFTSNVMLPLSGLLITLFAAWVMCRNSSADELGGAGSHYKLWRFLARYLAPLAIVIIFLRAIGML